MFVRKDKNKQKEAGVGTFLKNNAKTGLIREPTYPLT